MVISNSDQKFYQALSDDDQHRKNLQEQNPFQTPLLSISHELCLACLSFTCVRYLLSLVLTVPLFDQSIPILSLDPDRRVA